MGRQRVSEQAPFRIRVGAGTGPDGLLGDDELLDHGVDSYIADWFRGLQGKPLPRWIGGLHIYWGDELLTSITRLREDGDATPPPSSSPKTATELAVIRAEVGHLEERRVALRRQLETDERALQRVQQELVAQLGRLDAERTRYEREVARIDDGLERHRAACEEQKTFFTRDLQVFRQQAEGVREVLHESTTQTRSLLSQIRQAEETEAQAIVARKVQAVSALTTVVNHINDLELDALDTLLTPGAQRPAQQGFWQGMSEAGFRGEDVIGLFKHLGEKLITAKFGGGEAPPT